MELDFGVLTDWFSKNLIYVVGSARGGSTFANRLIGMHPSLLCVHWNEKTFSNIWPQIATLSDEELRRWIFRASADPNGSGPIGPCDAETQRKWNLHVERVLRTRNLPEIFALYGISHWLAHAREKPLSALRGWCIKANSWEGVDQIKRVMPTAQFVFIMRDPRSTALSFAKVFARRRQERFGDRDLIRGTLNWLRNATEFAVRLARYEDAHLVYFEQLVCDPIATLNTLYRKLGLGAFDSSELRQGLNAIEYSQTKTYEERGKPQTLSGVQAVALDRWRHQLSEDQIHCICALAGPGARFYGYELDQGASLSSLIQALAKVDGAVVIKCIAMLLYCQTRLMFLPEPSPRELASPA